MLAGTPRNRYERLDSIETRSALNDKRDLSRCMIFPRGNVNFWRVERCHVDIEQFM